MRSRRRSGGVLPLSHTHQPRRPYRHQNAGREEQPAICFDQVRRLPSTFSSRETGAGRRMLLIAARRTTNKRSNFYDSVCQ